ncbi:16S rRNA (guanine(527)-N(7))-methyltransferase RsmG [Solwaraspora sp. WMMB335]|uniref:16S rRNA (guanine(527)-N(7))-methyltransferase RsmG n=1 Tax=Solwaraspora sp. WMMB335 TaxID=3404118 RepID=UPI003B95E25F
MELATRYAELLATDGVLRGLIGPREVPRIWERHLLNCAVLAELIPIGTTVLDVGSGAGLPGIVLAIARPDLTVVLLEPMARRSAFLLEAVNDLDLAQPVEVIRGRAQELQRSSAGGVAPIVTARALAPLDRLATWCLPLASPGGRLLAMKGSSAGAEIEKYAAAVHRAGGAVPVVRHCGERWLDPPTTVVEIARLPERPRPGTRGGAGPRSVKHG